ncbi:hypothetical protein TNCV_3421501 [Trichonephila clavipes]|nr:hypothetical protein TNCV_3421501 [Trichonephila clavipes]
MVHQLSYSIFGVGGEAIPVMPLKEKRKTQERQICWSRAMFKNQRGNVTNGKKMILERPLLVVWILTESACHLGGGRTPENRRVRFQCCRDHGDRGMDQLVTVLFTDEYFQRTEESVSMWLRSWRSKHKSTGDCSLRK